MLSDRWVVVISALAVVASGACIDAKTFTDAPTDAPPMSYGFVVSQIAIPTTAAEAVMLGLDVDGNPSDGADNQLGTFLASIGALGAAIDLNDDVTNAIDRGLTISLISLRAHSLTTATATAQIDLGTNPRPPACADLADRICRQHLSGVASFDRTSTAGGTTALPGAIVDGRFVGGPGAATLSLGFSTRARIDLPLQRARLELVELSAAGFGTGSKLGGAATLGDVETTIYPAILTSYGTIIDRDCPPPRTPPLCNCVPSSAGADLLGFLDADADCQATLAELTVVMDGILTADIDLDGDGQPDAVSFGVGIEGVAATYPQP